METVEVTSVFGSPPPTPDGVHIPPSQPRLDHEAPMLLYFDSLYFDWVLLSAKCSPTPLEASAVGAVRLGGHPVPGFQDMSA